MEHFHGDVRLPLETIYKSDESVRKCLQKFMSKQIWSPNDRNRLLSELSNLLMTASDKTCILIATLFGPLTIELLHRCAAKLEDNGGRVIVRHERICIVLGWLCSSAIPSLSDFTLAYLEKHGAPFKRLSVNNLDISNGSEAKKRKLMDLHEFNEVLEATYSLIMKYPMILNFDWEWSILVGCLQQNDLDISSRSHWCLTNIVASVIGLSNVKNNEISQKEEQQFMLDCQLAEQGNEYDQKCVVTIQASKKSHTKRTIVSNDLSSQLVAVCGVLLHKHQIINDKENISSTELVVTESLKPQLQELALAVSDGNSVLLEGPVGCGKTAVVEHLAQITGHTCPPYLTKVQLSDDTDSKTLTGTYVCTAVPGEFIWQPGILVQACRKGYWLLLEDIDRAPMDVVSLLLPLIESGQLSIPGRSDEENQVSTGFRLFMTRRVATNSSYIGHLGIGMITKHTKTIKLEPIPDQDLREIIFLKHPNLESVIEKLLLIYGKLQDGAGLVSNSAQRKPSTRDLLKWCHRVSSFISTEGADISAFVALSAIDCFVASCPKPSLRLSMVEEICPHLNISTQKTEYYCNSYKPEIEMGNTVFKVGRSSIVKIASLNAMSFMRRKQPFAETRHSCVLLERVACCIETSEPVLLVGETGVGKTSALQYLAQETGRELHVVNMSQQSSSADLLGGYKPAQVQHFVAPVREEFERLFPGTFSRNQNQKFLTHIQTCYTSKRYNDLWHLMMHSSNAAIKRLTSSSVTDHQLLSTWKELVIKLDDLRLKLKSDSPIAFSFIEGKLSQCIERGDWLLLDEINLASADTLECLSGVLESESGSIVLMERGDAKPIKRHKEFRLFAAMNPATDVGKRNLSDGIRNRFTEIFVDEPTDDNDIATIVAYYLKKRAVGSMSAVDGIVKFYKEVRKLANDKLVDGTGRKPHYSLRTLCRSLRYVCDNAIVPLPKALYEGFCLSFLTALDRSSHPLVVVLIVRLIVGKSNIKSVLAQPLPATDYLSVLIEGHHIRRGDLEPSCDTNYIITDSVQENLQDLARPVSYGKYPILIQGETSTGKTSLIRYLAAATGNKVIRINNHEHTDLQEYVGCYASDENGKLVYQDGPLVTAMREGYWVILDELNLAPTDILEALNRVLDDNRELFITETQEVVQAHPRFTLFATQNPPGLYGGRKVLSRAFRNRFVELHFDEIPTDELKIILHKRCHLAPTHCTKLIKVMLDLQARRRASGLFAGKHGFITLRDLFRWAERHRRHQVETSGFYDWEQHIANDGFLLLASRVRKKEEEKVIEEVLEKHFGRSINHECLFGIEAVKELVDALPSQFDHIVWTKPLRRLYVTLERALRFDEPILLIGETGGGKTTACQMISAILKRKLAIVNCHANSEAADFIGGLRPARHQVCEDADSSDEKSMKLFEWADGPLVQSMNAGYHILVDEISLADDSVLERLNSVLEPERTLVIPDKVSMNGIDEQEDSFVVAKTGFQFMATMNPGGDYGKKELSPALRNRMTEIWCDVVHEHGDLTAIVQHNLHLMPSTENEVSSKLYADLIVGFVEWFKSTVFGRRFVISVRDLLTWSKFMSISCSALDLPSAYIHAACLVYVDGLGSGLSGAFASQSLEAHSECLKFIVSQLNISNQLTEMSQYTQQWLESEMKGNSAIECQVIKTEERFGIQPFVISTAGPSQDSHELQFTFQAHTTSVNALRVLRALQLPRPVLLEGSPGGGKTSLVTAIAKSAGYHLVRINLSEQTDASDLFGADLPVENGQGGQFSWRDGPLLAAMKAGHWVVLDELNLASQSVLESLNSVFDHRGELYVPELSRYFHVDREKTKIFACQNPVQEGGGRKGLPKSFLNRFTQVHVDNLSSNDLLFILETSFPQIAKDVLKKMVHFNQKVYVEVVCERKWGHRGSPWEFNLRDMTRWCQLVVADVENKKPLDVSKHMYLIYSERMRCISDREKMYVLFHEIFNGEAYAPSRYFHITPEILQIGNSITSRRKTCNFVKSQNTRIIPSMLHAAESLVTVLNQNWPCIVTGLSGSGKSHLIKTVAGLVGCKLRILSTNSAMDAIELLGGYEQYDAAKTLITLISIARKKLLDCCQVYLLSPTTQKTLSHLQNLLKASEQLQKCSKRVESDAERDNIDQSSLHIEQELTAIIQFACHCITDEDVTLELQDCLTKFQQALHRQNTKGTYEWTDSVLVKALQQGDWLLVDGANFCSASVLDRLNALLEPNGVLTVTERGVIDGKVTEIKPHKDFRLIFAFDPSFGELSRAMRNRCVEIHLSNTDNDVIAQTEVNLATSDGLTWDEVNFLIKSKCGNSAERNSCEFMLQQLETSGDAKRLSIKMEVLGKVDNMLKRIRCGLDSNPTCPSVQDYDCGSPCTRDFIARPTLSVILRQFKVFENILILHRQNEFSLCTILASFFRLYVALSTRNDYPLRNLLVCQFLPCLFDEKSMKIDFKKLFSTLTECVFSNPELKLANSEILHSDELPWDPRWNEQLLQRFGACTTSGTSIYNKIMLNITFIQLKCEEDQLNIPFVPRKKKGYLKNVATFQMASGFSMNMLRLSDLPHQVLVYVIPFYQTWNTLVGELLKSEESFLSNEVEFVCCEGFLREISFIWKHFMVSKFMLEDFTNRFIHLKKQMFKFVSKLVSKKHSEAYGKLTEVIESIAESLHVNGRFEQEQKARNKIRSSLIGPSVKLFHDEESSKLHCCLQSMLHDITSYAEQVFKDNTLSKLTWLGINKIVADFVNLHFSFEEGSSRKLKPEILGDEVMDIEEQSLLKDIAQLSQHLHTNGIQLSAKSMDILAHIGIKVDKCMVENSPSTSQKTFSVTPQKLQLWPISDFFMLLSELSLLSVDRNSERIASLNKETLSLNDFGLDLESCFLALLATKDSPTLFEWRGYILSKMWQSRILACDYDENNNSDTAPQELQLCLNVDGGPNILLRPHISQNVFSIMYHGSTNDSRKPCSSLDQLSDLVWNGVRVSLNEVCEKVQQLDMLSKTLWKNSSLLTQVKCDSVSLSHQFLHLTIELVETFNCTLKGIQNAESPLLANEKLSATCQILISGLSSISTDMKPLHESVIKLMASAQCLCDHLVEFNSVQSEWLACVMKVLSNCVNSVLSILDTTLNKGYIQYQHDKTRKDWTIMCWKYLGEAWLWCGYLEMMLVAPRGYVDPIMKHKSKAECLSAELLQCKCDLHVWNLSHRNLTGCNLISDDNILQYKHAHPRIEASMLYACDLHAKIKHNEDKTAFRPTPSKFHQLSKQCNHFTSTAASLSSLEDLVRKLSSKKGENMASKMEAKLQRTLSTFSNGLEESFPAYPDFVKPLKDSVLQMKFGLCLVRGASQLSTAHYDIESDLKKMDSPYVTVEKFISQFISGQCGLGDIDNFISMVKCLQNMLTHKGISDGTSADEMVERILITSLLQTYEQVQSNPDVIEYENIIGLVENVIRLWNKHRELVEQMEAEQSSLFRYKQHKHELNEEEEIEGEFQKLFPSFQEDIADLMDRDALNDEPVKQQEAQTKEDGVNLSTQAYDLVALIHSEIVLCRVNNMTNTAEDRIIPEKAKRKSKRRSNVKEVKFADPTSNMLLPILYAHRMMSTSVNQMFSWLLGNEFDHQLSTTHLLATMKLKEFLNSETYHGYKKDSINPYSDATPSEVSRCLPILQNMRSTVTDKLLAEWPDHPTLTQVVLIIDRILSFTVNFPIMKFVTGLELLLSKAQEWESNAYHQVSIANHLEAVTGLILDWRRLELKSWNRLLDDAQQSAATDTTKWWFYIYQLIEDCLQKSQEENYSSVIKEVITSLQKFIETSTIVQFRGRIKLLNVFYHHLVLKGKKDDPLAVAIYNVHQYYKQFQLANDNRMMALRQPIEKQMKDFVKIAKWNDLNFYAVQQSTAKTHRSLFKHVRKFTATLQEPISLNVLKSSPTLFTVGKESRSHGLELCVRWKENVLVREKSDTKELESLKDLLQQFGEIQSIEDELTHVKRLPTIVVKLCKHCSKWIDETNAFLPDWMIELEETTSNIIENFNVMRGLEPSTPSSSDKELREKRLSEAKYIQSRKRRALSDLFKLLHRIGLSYRKGQVWGKTFESQEVMLTQSPCTVANSIANVEATSFSHISSNAIESGDKYFYKMISRWSSLMAALVSPNKEVGVSNINRLQGFTNHLLHLSINQRRNIAQLKETETMLKDVSSTLHGFSHCQDQKLPCQNDTFDELQKCIMATNQWFDTLKKFKEILDCCPSKSDHDGFRNGNVLSHVQHPEIASCSCGDEMWNKTVATVQTEIDLVKKIKTVLSKEIKKCTSLQGSIKSGVLILSTTTQTMAESFEKIINSAKEFCQEMFLLFDVESDEILDANNMLMHSPLLVDVIEGRNKLTSCYNMMTNKQVFDVNLPEEHILQGMNDLIADIMLAVQNLVKNIPEEVMDNSSTEGLLDGHLVKHVHHIAEVSFQNLNIKQINSKILKLMKNVKTMSGIEENEQVVSFLLHSMLRVIKQYADVVRHTLLSSSLLHRSTCKLTYILSNLFAEVVSKGFCPPAEFEEELAGEGEFKEVEDAGIGEGQGSKDVSDQIEEEEQVEDVPGSEPPEENDEHIPAEDNAIEMSNDFEGKFQDDNAGGDKDQDENESDEEEEDEEDLEKQMGDLGDESQTDKLDERMWGSDDEDEEEQKDKKEEKGTGMDQGQSELAARDDEVTEGNDKEEKEDKPDEENVGDQSEFDPNERDDFHENEPNEPPEAMQLPDDIKIGDNDDNNDNEEDEERDDELGEDKLDENKDDPAENDEAKSDKDNEKEEEDGKENEQDEAQKDDGDREMEEHVDEDEPMLPDQTEDEEDAGMEEGKEESGKQNDELQNEEEDNDKDDTNDARSSGTQLPIEEDNVEDHEVHDKTSRREKQSTEDEVMQSECAQEEITQQMSEEGKDEEKGGAAPSVDQIGLDSSNLTMKNVSDSNAAKEEQKENERKVGQSDSKRTLGDSKDVLPKRLRMIEDVKEQEENEKSGSETADLHQHISEDVKGYDQQTLDAATEDQLKQQSLDDVNDNDDAEETPANDNEGEKGNDDDVVMATVDEDDTNDEKPYADKAFTQNNEIMAEDIEEETAEKDKIKREENFATEDRDLPLSSVHTDVAHWTPSMEFMSLTPEQIASIRVDMEDHLKSVAQIDQVDFAEAETMWHQYQSVTQPLSQQLSEQLRLILEPTRAAKLKGDYRSGKRLNMRKVIPYIASGFRKDKIWLRRSKPSKREYQIMVAIDDSSSMADNHTKQLAFESVAVISNALSTLEAGQLAICNFGETTQLLHDFNKPFTDQSGAGILQQCSFKQDQTKIAKLLDTSVGFMKAAEASYSSSADPRISKLLLIISDGRGLYIEGKEKVQASVRAAKDAGIFLAFVVLDNPAMKDSILDIKVPIFKEPGKMPEIRSYMADFPFPFYVIIRNINALPETLSEALRQWFEIVTSAD